MTSGTAARIVPVLDLLLVCSDNEDRKRLEEIACQQGWRLHCAASCAEARPLLATGAVGTVLCASHLPDGTWREVLAETGRLHCPPSLVVFSRQADDRLWAEVLQLGAWDLLLAPFADAEVVVVIRQAARDYLHRSGGCNPPGL